jgi:hypothetical protein
MEFECYLVDTSEKGYARLAIIRPLLSKNMSETREGMVPFEVLIQVINQMLKT